MSISIKNMHDLFHFVVVETKGKTLRAEYEYENGRLYGKATLYA